MTTKKFADYINKQTKNIDNIMLEPIFDNYIVHRNGKRIGVINDNKLYLLSTDNLKKQFPNAIEENPFGWGYHRLIYIENTEDTEILKQAIITTYNDLYFPKEFVCDIASLFQAYRSYADSITRIYELHITFLRYCYQKDLLKINPLDRENRILHMYYTNNDLTEKGIHVFPDLYMKWLKYTDKDDEKTPERIANVKMLEKYYTKIIQEEGINE